MSSKACGIKKFGAVLGIWASIFGASSKQRRAMVNIFETNQGTGLPEDFIFSSSITFVQAITVLRHPAAAMEL